AAKEGIVGLTRTIARDMGRYGITCNAIRPRAATRLTITPELEANWKRAQAQGLPTLGDYDELRAMMPEHVAELVVYLATDTASNVNGQVFLVGGNMIAAYPDTPPTKFLFKEAGGSWTAEELVETMPKTLTKDIVNPSPPSPLDIAKK
ncbi:MAG: SDR family oxidoreductase, partial [Dehalococcoidia bacterium]|nr:SDR family oxidoreductase [Dehalococcoidia bacterium]